MSAEKKDLVIRFGCAVRLPKEGRFHFAAELERDAERFVREWIDGAVSNIYSGPKIDSVDPHTGALKSLPTVKVKIIP